MSDGAAGSGAPSSPTRAPTSTRRAVLNTVKGSAGNLVEWYDVYTYTVSATYFEAQFFDKNDTNSALPGQCPLLLVAAERTLQCADQARLNPP